MDAALAPLIAVRDLAMTFARPRTVLDRLAGRPAKIVRALNGVSFSVKRGETLGIVGESGCGKSTLARCLVRLYQPDAGRIDYGGVNVLALDGAERRAYNRRVQMVFQDPYSSLNPRMTVRQTLAEAIGFHNLRQGDAIGQRVAELLDLVRLPSDAADRYPHEFSGGQRQRIGIARALAVEPECLIADELVSALDVSVQAQIVNLLLELQARLELTVLFIAHDLRLVRHISHRVARPSLYGGLAQGSAGIGPRPAYRGRCGARRIAEPAGHSRRLPLPSALPLRHGPLPDRTAAIDRARPRPYRGLPSLAPDRLKLGWLER